MSTKFIEQVVKLTNNERAKAGLPPLKLNNKLVNAAQDHSSDMAQDDFFSHTGADGSSIGDRVKGSGYQYSRTGENIAAGQPTPEAVVRGWMNSPGHRANILNPNYTEIGVGYEYLENDTGSVNYNHYWTQVFGTPLNNNAGSRSTPTPPQPDPVEEAEAIQVSKPKSSQQTKPDPIEAEAIEQVSKPKSSQQTKPDPVEVEAIEQVSKPKSSQQTKPDPVEVEAIEQVSNSKIEQKGDPLIESTTDDGQFNIDNANNNVSKSNNSTSFSISYSYSVSSNGYSDSLTGTTNNLALTGGDSAIDFDDSGKTRKASWYIKQFKNSFSDLLDDPSLGSSVEIPEDSDVIDFIEDISNSDLTKGQKNQISKMLDSFI